MCGEEKKEYLLVVWKDYITRSRFVIGELHKGNGYTFKYRDTRRAQERGFRALIAFPDLMKEYRSEEMFKAFTARIPSEKRKDINEILEKYDLQKYDAFELLKKSGGLSPIDTLEFAEPINSDEFYIRRFFYIAGVRHYEVCQGRDEQCVLNLDIKEGEMLEFIMEPTNEYNNNAVIISKRTGETLGYVPDYYCEEVTKAMKDGRKLSCKVHKFRRINCQQCIWVEMIIE